MRLQVLEVTRLRKGQAGARTSRKEKGKVMLLAFEVVLFGGLAFMFSVFCAIRTVC